MSHRTVFLALLALTIAGCQAASPQQVAKQEAERRWNAARADVKARLAAEELAAGRVDSAALALDEARRLHPDPGSLRLVEARILMARGAANDAEHVLIGIAPDHADAADAFYLLGVIAQQRGERDEAAERYQSALQRRPDDPALLSACIQALLAAGRAADARVWLESVKPRMRWSGAYQASLAEVCEQGGEWGRAADAWRLVVGDAKDNPPRERLAMALFRAERWAEAVEELRAAIAADPQSARTAPLRLALADSLLTIGDAQSAEQQVATLLSERPGDTRALRLRARVQAKAGDFAGALATIQPLIDSPQDRDAATIEFAAVVALRAGRADLAERWARLALASDSDARLAAEVLARLGR